MPRIVVFIHEFISALQHLKHYCHYWNAAERSILSVHPIIATQLNSHVHGYGKKAYILKYLLDVENNLINIGCATLYHLSMTYITVYNLSINGHAKERPSASEEVVARPRNIFARPRTFLARPSPIQVNPSYFSSFERMVNETFWTSSMPI